MSKKTSEVKREIEHLIGDRLVVISNGTKATVRFKEAIKAVLDWHTKAVAKEKMELVERIYKKLDILMPEKRARELGDNLEMFRGERSCTLCGTNPELQRQMILDILSAIKSEIQEKEEEVGK